MSQNFSHVLTNYSADELNQKVANIQHRINSQGISTSGYSKDQLFNLIDQLLKSDLGKFLLINKGLNGYWTDYILNTLREEIAHLPWIDQVIINSRSFTASYERQQIFKRESQKFVSENTHLASIPSGLMSELLDLDYSGINNIEITAIDLDKQSFEHSYCKYSSLYEKYKINTLCIDALQLLVKAKFDLITSNGLSIYISDHAQIQQLYANFYQALKPGGKLVTSFLACPKADCDKQKPPVNKDKHQLEVALFVDVLQVGWSCFMSTEKTIELLNNSGFMQVQIIPDSNYVFPTVVAYKF